MSTAVHRGTYRRPHVSRVIVNGHDTSSGKEDAEEEEEWSDDSNTTESSNFNRLRTAPFNSHGYDENLDRLQNRMMARVKTQPTVDHSPYASDTARISRRYSNMSSNSPGGQAVPYGYSAAGNPFTSYPGQQYDPSSQHYPHHTQYVPPPPQFYPSAYPEVESIRQELEDMRMETRERERRMEKQRAEENRRKKKRAEYQRKRKAKQQEETQRLAFERKLQQIEADFEKRLESVSNATRHRDHTADLHSILSNLLPPQPAAGHYGHGYGHSSEDKQARDMSEIMRRLDSLAAPERHAPPNRWFERQGPSIPYHYDRPLMDDLYNQVDDMKRRLYNYEHILSTLLPYQQAASPFADKYYLPREPGYPMSRSPFPLVSGRGFNRSEPPELVRPSRKMRTWGSRTGGRSSPPAEFSGVEEPPENVEAQRRNYNYRRYASDDGGDDNDGLSDGDVSAYTATADHVVDRNQRAAANVSRKVRKQRLSSKEKPEARENNNNAVKAHTHSSNSMAAQRIDADGEDSGHSSDASDELEQCKQRPNRYATRPESRFGREKFQTRDRHPKVFDQLTYDTEDHTSTFLVPSPPLTPNEAFDM